MTQKVDVTEVIVLKPPIPAPSSGVGGVDMDDDNDPPQWWQDHLDTIQRKDVQCRIA